MDNAKFNRILCTSFGGAWKRNFLTAIRRRIWPNDKNGKQSGVEQIATSKKRRKTEKKEKKTTMKKKNGQKMWN